MRLPLSSVRRLMTPATHMVARFRHTLRAPLRRPRMTTRLLMLLVAIVAVGIWAAMNVPRVIDRANAYQEKAEYHADWERDFQDRERESSTRARAIQSELDQWRRDTRSADAMTEHYFASRLEFESVDANYQREMAAYHAKLRNQYRWARWFPFVSVPPDPAPPPEPQMSPPLKGEPGKIYEMISNRVISIAFSPSGSGLAVGCRDNTFRFLELPSRRVLASFLSPQGNAVSSVFSRDGETLFSVGNSPLVWRWDVATGRAGRALPWIDRSPGEPGLFLSASAMSCSPDGATIALAAGGSQGIASPSNEIYAVRLLDTRTGELKWEHRGTGTSPLSVAFSPDGKTLACGAGPAVLLDARTGKVKKTLKPLVGAVIAAAFSADGRTLAGGGSDVMGRGGYGGSGRVTLWDVSTGRILLTLVGPTGRAQTVAFSPDGRMVAAGGSGPGKMGRNRFSGRRAPSTASEVRLWDIATGRMVWTIKGESGAAFSLAFSPDGRSLAFCDQDYVYIIDANTGRLRQIVMETTIKYRARDRAPTTAAAIPRGRSSGGE